jgi:methylated-DNA-[protein]-cysteine S-methyltransferase
MEDLRGADSGSAPGAERHWITTPIGWLELEAHEDELVGIKFHFAPPRDEGHRSEEKSGVLRQTASWIEGYFAGKKVAWNISVRSEGTPFQRRVWDELRSVGYGETVTYGSLAQRIGSPGGSRAVGAACAVNPLLLLIPCHRVVPARGGVGGFVGGTERKRWLLAHEKRLFSEKA